MKKNQDTSSQICLNCPYDDCYMNLIDTLSMWLSHEDCNNCYHRGSACFTCENEERASICKNYIKDQLANDPCGTECSID